MQQHKSLFMEMVKMAGEVLAGDRGTGGIAFVSDVLRVRRYETCQ